MNFLKNAVTKLEGSHIVLLPELTPCVVSVKNCNTKEDKDKSMIHTVASTAWDKVMSNSETFKPVALYY